MLRNYGVGQWERGIVRHVNARRYVPMDAAPTGPGVYRIDRFTVRAEIGDQTGSRLTQRVGNLTVHVTDRAETDAMIDAKSGRRANRRPTPPARRTVDTAGCRRASARGMKSVQQASV